MPVNLDVISQSTSDIIPLIIILITGLVLMLMDSFSLRERLSWVAGAGLLLSALVAIGNVSLTKDAAFYGMIETSGLAALVHIFICFAGIFTLLFLKDYLDQYEKPIPDVYALLMFSLLGMVLLANAADLIITFIGLEIMSIALYIFAALYKNNKGSNEAGLKYFLLGSFSSAFLLFGIAMMYGISGHTNLAQIGNAVLDLSDEYLIIFYAGAGLILVGFLFKIAAFPFHNWTPDVYEGTPTPLAGLMSTGSKMAAFVAFGHIIYRLNFLDITGEEGFDYEDKIGIVLAVCALITMIYGNIVAARQRNLKRMLAYSSIAHSGYALLGLCSGEEGFLAVIFYMSIYTIMNIGAFGVVGIVERSAEDGDISKWNGLWYKAPILAGTLAVFLFSLAGIPPLAGFIGKYQVFLAAIRSDLVLLAIMGILSAVVGAYYYLRVVIIMFADPNGESSLATHIKAAPRLGIVLLATLIILLGIFPSLIYQPIYDVFWEVEISYTFLADYWRAYW